jgi:ABC-type branched-subunit amino acid transport system substrate-binding protein
VKQAFQQGLNVRFWGPVTMQTEDFTKAIGSNYKDLVDDGKVIFASDFIPTNPSPVVQKFVKLWQSKYHSVPTTDIASLYVGHLTLLNAIKKISGSVTKEKLLPLLKATSLSDTPLGNVSFDSSGKLKCPPLFIGDWSDGEPHLLKDLSPSCAGLK